MCSGNAAINHHYLCNVKLVDNAANGTVKTHLCRAIYFYPMPWWRATFQRLSDRANDFTSVNCYIACFVVILIVCLQGVYVGQPVAGKYRQDFYSVLKSYFNHRQFKKISYIEILSYFMFCSSLYVPLMWTHADGRNNIAWDNQF